MASIIVVEDQPFVLEGICSFLSRMDSHQVVASCTSGLEALDAVARFRPDLLLVDLQLPELDGLEVIRRVHLEHSFTRIVALSIHSGGAYVYRAIRNGADGYLLNDANLGDLETAVNTVLNGEQFFSPGISARIDQGGEIVDLYDELTSREREVLHLVAEGKSTSDIENILYISSRTVEKHRSNLMKKLGFHSQGELIRYALERGLLPVRGPSGGSA